MTPAAPRRLLIYAHFDPHGMLDPHVVYQIRAVRQICRRLVFVSNSPLDAAARKLLSSLDAAIMERPDEGYDFGAWRQALLAYGPEGLGPYDELVIMNDSCYGPVFPLDEMLEAMAKTGVDFWAPTRDTVPRYGDHLQNYFCVFRKTLLNSTVFWNFWRNLKPIHTFTDAVCHGELTMTRTFDEAGFSHSSYVEQPPMVFTPVVGPDRPLVYTIVPWLIRKWRLPLFKIKAFRTALGKQFNSGIDVYRALKDSGSNYPYELVLSHLARTKPLSWSKNQPGFLNVFPEHGEVLGDPGMKIAVFLHLFYEDTFPEAIGWLKNLPYPFDLYLSISSEEKKEHFLQILSHDCNCLMQNAEVRICEDRGRDVAPWMLMFNDVQQNYDIALKMHIKRRAEPNVVFLQDWKRFIIRSAMASASYISQIINLFHKRHELGIVFHPYPPTLLMSCRHHVAGPPDTKENFHKSLELCGVRPAEETACPVFPQNIFWYRPKALRKLFTSPITLDDFVPEPFPDDGTLAHGLERSMPYIVQGSGYACAQAMTREDFLEAYQHYEDHILNIL